MCATTIKATLTVAVLLASALANQFVMYTPGGDDTAIERIDQIISPGAVAGHVHQLFGSNGLSSNMTYDSLQEATCTTVGAAEGSGNSQDHSVYWHPALYAQAADGSGYMRIPTSGHKMYYRDGGNAADKKADPFEFPKGFRMIAGNMAQRVPYEGQAAGITQWFCHGNGDVQSPGFPKDVTDCPQYPGFNGAIHFPHCWNGEDFDQANPTAHMSYPDGDPQAGPCPSTHPIRLPHIFIENEFDIHSVAGKFKPNTLTLAQGDPTGYGWHMDFFNGWEKGAIPALLNSCVQGQWGNEDVGLCSAFKKGVPTKACKLSVTYKENIDSPGPHLPGCNPVVKTNPAPKNAIAALGVCTDTCGAGAFNSGESHGPSPPTYNPPSSSSSSVSLAPPLPSQYSSGPLPQPSSGYSSPSSSSISSEVIESVAATSAPSAPARSAASPAEGNIVYVTEWVTVTRRELAPTAAAKQYPHARQHARGLLGKQHFH